MRINGFFSSWQAITSQVPKVSVPATVLAICVNDLDEGTKYTVAIFVDDTIGGLANCEEK